MMRTLFVEVEGGLFRATGDLPAYDLHQCVLSALAGFSQSGWALVLISGSASAARRFIENLLRSENIAVAEWRAELPKDCPADSLHISGTAERIHIRRPETPETPLEIADWTTLHDHFRRPPRQVRHARNTRETQIEVTLNLDGGGTADIATGIGFFDHMLEQLARHGLVDIKLAAKGDLHIDAHHTIEDVAITLGEAFAKALGDKAGLARYGFCLPMDDCLAQAAVDFCGRSYWVWDAKFHREQVGGMPTEMFQHFFRSFADAARMNINIQASGDNEHHKIEAIFKAFARALRMALRRDPASRQLPSTKGVL